MSQTSFWNVLGAPEPGEHDNPAQVVYTKLWKGSHTLEQLAEILEAFSAEDFRKYPTAGIALLGSTRHLGGIRKERVDLAERIREDFIELNGSDIWLQKLLD